MKIRQSMWKPYCIIFMLVTLLSAVFTMLRSARSAIAVADIGGSASMIPYYELIGTLPATIALTWVLSKWMRTKSLPAVFMVTLASFVGFFLFFGLVAYPLWRNYAPMAFADSSLLINFVGYIPVVTFFVVAELWKIALLSILLWGFVNRHVSMENAKGAYAPLMLGISIGAVVAGPLTTWCTKNPPLFISALALDRWHAAFSHQMIVIAVISVFIAILFIRLQKCFKGEIDYSPSPKLDMGLCFKRTLESTSLRGLAIIVMTDYLSYTLFEVIFFDTLKVRYPDPADYCAVMGSLGLWAGIVTAVGAIIVGPWLLNRFSWIVIAMVTPVTIVTAAIPFLSMVLLMDMGWLDMVTANLDIAILCGCACYCLCRGSKYALLDSAKELAYIPLSKEDQLAGKLTVEGLASRGGRALASVSSIALTAISGGVGASAPFALVLVVVSVWFGTRATQDVGKEMARNEGLGFVT